MPEFSKNSNMGIIISNEIICSHGLTNVFETEMFFNAFELADNCRQTLFEVQKMLPVPLWWREAQQK